MIEKNWIGRREDDKGRQTEKKRKKPPGRNGSSPNDFYVFEWNHHQLALRIAGQDGSSISRLRHPPTKKKFLKVNRRQPQKYGLSVFSRLL